VLRCIDVTRTSARAMPAVQIAERKEKSQSLRYGDR